VCDLYDCMMYVLCNGVCMYACMYVYVCVRAAWLAWLTIFDFNIFVSSGNVCVAPLEPLAKLSIGIIVPAICIVQLLLTFLINLAYWYCKHGRFDDGIKIHKSPYIRTLFGFLLFSYNSVVSSLIKYLGCLKITDTLSVVRSKPAISCTNNEEYDSLKPLFSFLLGIIGIGAPIAILIGLCYNHLKKHRLWTTKFLSRYGILFEAYQQKRYLYMCLCVVLSLSHSAHTHTHTHTHSLAHIYIHTRTLVLC